MASKVQICNLALAELGANTIVSLTDNTTEAKLCNTFYNDTADEVMAEGSWTSAVTRATLNKLVTTPAYGFSFQFQLPSDPFCLRVLDINEEPLVPGESEYRIEGRLLLTDESAIKIKYVGRVDDTESYDIYLKRSIVALLKAKLAYPLTGQVKVAEAFLNQYQDIVANGLSADGQQGSNELIITPDLTKVR